MNRTKIDFGALVISLDLELIWGMRHMCGPDHPYLLRMLKERQIVPRILELFKKYSIAATWAVVGFLFCRNRSELKKYSPSIRPYYANCKLDPYREPLGENEYDDPLHYGLSILQQIMKVDRQEIGSHTFSHYYCLEKGQTADSFNADLKSALAVARKYGISLKSIVFPQNQYNREYDSILFRNGFTSFRGNEEHFAYEVGKSYNNPIKRAFRLLDTYLNLSGNHLIAWDKLKQASGLYNIPSSRFLRSHPLHLPVLRRLRKKRIERAMLEAAQSKKIFHLWWHPHNFGKDPDEHLEDLEELLQRFTELREKYRMQSLNMQEIVAAVKEGDRCRGYFV